MISADLRRPVGSGLYPVLLLIALLWGTVYMLTPFQLDDWQFMGVYRDLNGGSDDFSLRAWFGYMSELRDNDNARLGNFLSPFSTIWRPWSSLFPWITGTLVSFIIWMASRLGFGSRSGWETVAVVWLLIALFLPWRDSLLVRDYALNYVWGAAVTLPAVGLIMALRSGARYFVVALAMAVVAGVWHEGFAVPSLCGLGVVALIRGFRMGWRWWLAVVVYGFSCLVMVLSPGMLGRASRELSGGGNPLTLHYIVDIFPLILSLGSVAVLLLFRAGRRLLGDLFAGWILPLFLTSAIVAGSLPLFVGYTPRVCFWSSLCSLIILVRLWSPLWFRLSSRLRIFAAALAIIICSAHLAFVISWQSRFHEESERVVAAIAESPTGTVFIDMIPKNAVPPATLLYPSRLMWVTPFNLLSMGHALSNRNIAVVPESLREALPDGSLRVDSGLELYRTPDGKALYAVPAPEMFPRAGNPLYFGSPLRAEVVLDDGTSLPAVDLPLFFYTSERGDTLLWIASPDIDPSRIKSLNLTDFRKL